MRNLKTFIGYYDGEGIWSHPTKAFRSKWLFLGNYLNRGILDCDHNEIDGCDSDCNSDCEGLHYTKKLSNKHCCICGIYENITQEYDYGICDSTNCKDVLIFIEDFTRLNNFITQKLNNILTQIFTANTHKLDIDKKYFDTTILELQKEVQILIQKCKTSFFTAYERSVDWLDVQQIQELCTTPVTIFDQLSQYNLVAKFCKMFNLITIVDKTVQTNIVRKIDCICSQLDIDLRYLISNTSMSINNS